LHLRPIDVVVFDGPVRWGGFISGPVSHLDAFSAYPLPTWLPGRATGVTAGSPAVGPPRSSRTEGGPPQSSCARHR